MTGCIEGTWLSWIATVVGVKVGPTLRLLLVVVLAASVDSQVVRLAGQTV